MKVSHKVLQKYIPNLSAPEEVAQNLIMHCAEVEEVISQWKNLEKVFIGEVVSCEKHPDSEKLNCTQVQVNDQLYPIVCGAPNARKWLKVAVALEGAQLSEDFIIKKTKIRGEESRGMICSEDELGLIEERQEWIMELPLDAPLGMCVREYFEKNDAILEIDNKAINHRPDLFSHIWIAREIAAISWETLNYSYAKKDFSSLEDLWIINQIPKEVSRYTGLKITWVSNMATPEYIKQVLDSAEVTSKGLLVDISNYSLYLYGQPTHCFDADSISWNITIRKATQDEKFTALNDVEYTLSPSDIVIADSSWVIALGGIIWGKKSAVSDTTTSIIVESAHFDQAIIRQTWKRLWIRTDALNVFEKDIVNGMQDAAMSLIAQELKKNIPTLSLQAYSDVYPNPQKIVTIDFDLTYINNLIGAEYSTTQVENILQNLGIQIEKNTLIIPFWRKDLNNKADIAEEIARIVGYDTIVSTIPRINLWAVIQSDHYRLKNDVRDFFCNRGYFDMYNYSFVSSQLMEKCLGNTQDLVPMKNALSEDMTHLRGSLIPNLLATLEKNTRDFSELKCFEIEKVFHNDDNTVQEQYTLSGVISSNSDVAYYEMQNTIADLLTQLGVSKYSFQTNDDFPSFSHTGRSAHIIVRWKSVGTLWEIHPKVTQNFELQTRVAYFEIQVDRIIDALYKKVIADDLSEFQANNFDLNFVVDKNTPASTIHQTIEKTNPNLIKKVSLIDIYENEDKLPRKRSLTFKIHIQSMDSTLGDSVKANIIEEITKKVEKKWGTLR